MVHSKPPSQRDKTENDFLIHFLAPNEMKTPHARPHRAVVPTISAPGSTERSQFENWLLLPSKTTMRTRTKINMTSNSGFRFDILLKNNKTVSRSHEHSNHVSSVTAATEKNAHKFRILSFRILRHVRMRTHPAIAIQKHLDLFIARWSWEWPREVPS